MSDTTFDLASSVPQAVAVERLRARGRDWRESHTPPALRAAGYYRVRIEIGDDGRFRVWGEGGAGGILDVASGLDHQRVARVGLFRPVLVGAVEAAPDGCRVRGRARPMRNNVVYAALVPAAMAAITPFSAVPFLTGCLALWVAVLSIRQFRRQWPLAAPIADMLVEVVGHAVAGTPATELGR